MTLVRSAGPLKSFPSHPFRGAALAEAHARPSLPITSPARVEVLVFVPDKADGQGMLFDDILPTPVELDARHVVYDMDGLRVKWERHTEFASITIVAASGISSERFIDRVATSARGHATLLCALRIDVKDSRPATLPGFAGQLKDGIIARSFFTADRDGFTHMDIFASGVEPAQLGRRVQRLCEIEIYRIAALLALPVARAEGPQLVRLEADVLKVTKALTEEELTDEDALSRLQPIAAALEAMRSRTRFRFGASRAYAALVEERLATLGEMKIASKPTISGFVLTRLTPAVRTITSIEDRQEDLSKALARSFAVLETRINLRLTKDNKAILASMNERQYRQLILAETVEGLSVIAISYYLLNLLGYPIKAWEASGTAPLSTTAMMALAAPLTIAVVFLSVRMVKRKILKQRAPAEG